LLAIQIHFFFDRYRQVIGSHSDDDGANPPLS
jgi:hypothetical protein